MTVFSLSFSATSLFSPGGVTGSHPSLGTGHTMSSKGKAIQYCNFQHFPNSLLIDGVSVLDSDEQRVHPKHLFQWFWGWFRDQCTRTFPLLKGLQCCFKTRYETQTLAERGFPPCLVLQKHHFCQQDFIIVKLLVCFFRSQTKSPIARWPLQANPALCREHEGSKGNPQVI